MAFIYFHFYFWEGICQSYLSEFIEKFLRSNYCFQTDADRTPSETVSPSLPDASSIYRRNGDAIHKQVWLSITRHSLKCRHFGWWSAFQRESTTTLPNVDCETQWKIQLSAWLTRLDSGGFANNFHQIWTSNLSQVSKWIGNQSDMRLSRSNYSPYSTGYTVRGPCLPIRES